MANNNKVNNVNSNTNEIEESSFINSDNAQVNTMINSNESSFESEPTDLYASVKIKNLTKVIIT